MHHALQVRSLAAAIFLLLALGLAGCGGADLTARPDVPQPQRPKLALLGFNVGVEITKLSMVQTVEEELSPEQEALLVKEAVNAIREDARRLLYNRLASSTQFQLVSLEETDAAVGEIGLQLHGIPTQEELGKLRTRLGVDLVVSGTVLDYGKVRWQWLAAGMAGDLTWETTVIGLATAWNPAIILGNVGFELATSTPVWFGGGYLFGVAFRPVRVEAQAVETEQGLEVWSDWAVAAYVRERLKELPESERGKKEVQLGVNLKKAMEALGDSLFDAGLTKTTLWERRLPTHDVVAF
jgi:hypothetical protein